MHPMTQPMSQPPAHQPDPIIAVATAPGKGAVGVVRVSGTNLKTFVNALLGRDLSPRYATYLPLLDEAGQVLDKGLALYFPAPHSFTGEDVFEFQAHGGSVLLQMIVARCLAVAQSLDLTTQQPVLPRLRLAQAGEFTQRAFLNDKMDLAEAEAVADLIDAATEQAVKSAARSMAGEFSQTVHQLLAQLVQLRMLVEACLDFPDEDIDFLEAANAKSKLDALLTQVQHVLQSAQQGALLRDGLKVVIAGQPNAGKSSLLNALAGAELAIVTPIAGTTRDKIEQSIQINGVVLHVTDTAGLRESDDVVEQMGVARAWDALANADIVLFLHDLPRWLGLADDTADPADASYAQADQHIAQNLQAQLPPGKRPVILHIWNKTDRVASPQLRVPHDASILYIDSNKPNTIKPERLDHNHKDQHLLLSANTGEGLPQLRQQLLQIAGWQAAPEGLFMARQRHVQALQNTQQSLQSAQTHLQTPHPALDLLAEELRQAQQSLSSITGQFTADDLLGVIFSQFCIGK